MIQLETLLWGPGRWHAHCSTSGDPRSLAAGTTKCYLHTRHAKSSYLLRQGLAQLSPSSLGENKAFRSSAIRDLLPAVCSLAFPARGSIPAQHRWFGLCQIYGTRSNTSRMHKIVLQAETDHPHGISLCSGIFRLGRCKHMGKSSSLFHPVPTQVSISPATKSGLQPSACIFRDRCSPS